MEVGSFGPVHLGWIDTFARIGAAVLFALAIGIERFVHKKAVDFRPFVIISVASCALAIAILDPGVSLGRPAPFDRSAKVMSGVMSGIGFLGAGALFKEEHYVQGAGSAAAIWAAGAIGLICGLGFVWLAGIVALTIVLLLLVGRRFADDYTVSGEHTDEDTSDHSA